MYKNLIGPITMLILASLFLGCSAGSGPSSPKIDNNPASQYSNAPSSSQNQLWGYWTIEINTSTGEWRAIPLRTADFTANVTKLLESKPGNLQIQNLDLSQFLATGRLDCTVTLRHPFPGLDKYDGFDVWGVFMGNGTTQLQYQNLTYGVIGNPSEAVLLNPDGYTRWFNQPEFNGTTLPLLEYTPGKLGNLPTPSAMLNGYKIFADGLGAEEDYSRWIINPANFSDRGVFRAGSSNSRRYQLQFPMNSGSPQLVFQYAVMATWEPGDPTVTGDPAVYDPGDFPSSANVDEPFFMTVTTVGSDLFHIDPSTFGGTLRARIEVFDWQGGSVGKQGVLSQISRIIIAGNFIPGGTQEIHQSLLPAIASIGTENSSVYQMDIQNCQPQASGSAEFWVIVESAGQHGASYEQGFPTKFPNGPRAAFLRSSANVSGQISGITVMSIEPNHAPFLGSVVGADIVGSGFQFGATVELRQGALPPVVGTNVTYMDSSHLKCDLDFKTANGGKYDVVVINPDLQEGTLKDGFTVGPWSDEAMIASGSFRLPMAQRSSGETVLVAGQSDDTMQYMVFDPVTITWGGPYLLAAGKGNDVFTAVAADTQSDAIYFTREGWLENDKLFKYTGGTGEWARAYMPVAGCRSMFLTVDSQGTVIVIDNTIAQFGHIYHFWANPWDAGYWGWHNGPTFDEFDPVGFPANKKSLSEGNGFTYDSTGTLYTVYDYDEAFESGPSAGPRSVRVNPIPLGGIATGSGFTKIDELTGDGIALDSPAITCMTGDVLHTAYRKYDVSTGKWLICHMQSTDKGLTWTPLDNIYSGDTAPGQGYVFLITDQQNHLSTLYINDKYFEYRHSADGTTWSSVEIANESAVDNPPGITDFAPRAMITSDGILHVAWIRGDASTGYGEIHHRMRDLY